MIIEGKVDFSLRNQINGWYRSNELTDSNTAHLICNGFPCNSAPVVTTKMENQKNNNQGEHFVFNIEETLSQESEIELKVFFGDKNFNYFNNFKFYNNTKQKDKIFFLHIPKTAGSSLNNMLSKKFRRKQVKFHIESDRANQFKNIDLQKLKLISGHVHLHQLIKHISLHNFLRVTVVRDPFQQLISHLNWVRFISSNSQKKFFMNYSEPIREISLKLREVDFENLNQVEKFINNLPSIGHRLFNNCQVRYLINEKNPQPQVLTSEHSKKAIETLHFFDVIGTVENMEGFIQKVSAQMGWKKQIKIKRKNVLKNKYKMDKGSEKLKTILRPLITEDQVLYDHILNL